MDGWLGGWVDGWVGEKGKISMVGWGAGKEGVEWNG